MRWPLLFVCACALAGSSLQAVAAEVAATAEKAWTLGSEPLQVDSDSLEARGPEGLVIFLGNVVARQADFTLHADRVEVRLDTEARDILGVEAAGSVRVQKEDMVAAGEHGSYDVATGVVVLTGEPKVWRDRNVIAGTRITLYLGENRSIVEGARAVLYPSDMKEKEPE